MRSWSRPASALPCPAGRSDSLVAKDRSAGGVRHRASGTGPSVRARSVSRRDTGRERGHQRSPTAKRSCKLCSASPYPPVGVAVVASGRLPPARVLSSCGAGCGWAGWAWPEGLSPTRPGRGRRPVWHPPGQPRSAGTSRGAGVPATPARSAAVDPGPGGRLAVTELLARVDGSSVSLNCPCADQGGRHVDMVVGADHCGRGGVGVWRVAASRPLTALRGRPGHGWRSCWTGPTAWRRGRWVQVQRAQPTSQRCPGPAGSGAQPGLGPCPRGHREQFVVGKAVSLAEQAKLFAGPVAASRGPPWRVSPPGM